MVRELLLIVLIAVVILSNITIMIYIIRSKQLERAFMQSQETKKKPPPKLKSQSLKYNPANLFDPYQYADPDGGDLDPVVPGKKEVKDFGEEEDI